MSRSIFLVFLLLVSGTFASGVPGIDSIPDPDGIQHAFWHGWVPGLKGLAWTKGYREEGGKRPWLVSMPNGWNRAGRIWQGIHDHHHPLWEHSFWKKENDWGGGMRLYKNSDPFPKLDSNFYWRSEPSLLDTATPLSLPGAGWIRWSGRYFWTAPESLWAEGRLESKSERFASASVEALLPAEVVDRPQTVTEFRPRLLRIALYDELKLNDGTLRSSRPLLLGLVRN